LAASLKFVEISNHFKHIFVMYRDLLELTVKNCKVICLIAGVLPRSLIAGVLPRISRDFPCFLHPFTLHSHRVGFLSARKLQRMDFGRN